MTGDGTHDGWEQVPTPEVVGWLGSQMETYIATGLPNESPFFRRVDGAAPQPERDDLAHGIGLDGRCEACDAAPPDGEVERRKDELVAVWTMASARVRFNDATEWGKDRWRARFDEEVGPVLAALSGSTPRREERPSGVVNIDLHLPDDGGFAAGYASGLRDGRQGR